MGIFTDSTLTTAREGFAGDLRGNLFDANQLLVRALDDIGSELVSAFTEASGILAGSTLAIQRIPEMAAAAAEMIEEPEAPADPDPLQTVFRPSGEQRDALGVLQGDITNAENAIRLLTEDSSPVQVLLAYQNLSNAETAYYDQQIAFVDEGVGIFTDSALETARTRASQMLTDSAFDANRSLVGTLEDVGLELVNAFSATSGFLNQTQLALQRIPEMAAAAAEMIEEPEAPADPDPLRDSVPFDRRAT